MTVRDTGVKGKALYICDDGKMLIYRKGSLFVYSSDYEVISRIDLPITKWKKTLGKVRLCERLLHIEPRFAVQVDEAHFLLQLGSKILLVDIKNNKITQEKVSFRGRPLGCAKIEKIKGFSDSIVIGDYGANDKGGEVNIYQRDVKEGKWRIAYTYEAGTMWHIHGFVPCRENDCVYVLTGDEDSQSGIWEARNDFKDLAPVVKGSQQYRTCQISYDDSNIYYFTDAPSEPNFLYSYNRDSKEVDKKASIRGTCIYGCQVPGGIIASTTCEPDAHFKIFIYGMITTKPGKGVKGRDVDLLYYHNNGNLEVLKTFKQDGLPLKLFQYGTVVFSNYNCGKVLCTPISVRKYDMCIHEVII